MPLCKSTCLLIGILAVLLAAAGFDAAIAEDRAIEPGIVEFEPISENFVKSFLDGITTDTPFKVPKAGPEPDNKIVDIWIGNNPVLKAELNWPAITLGKLASGTGSEAPSFTLSFEFRDRYSITVIHPDPQDPDLAGGIRMRTDASESIVTFFEGRGDSDLIIAEPASEGETTRAVLICPRTYTRSKKVGERTRFAHTGYDVTSMRVQIDGEASGEVVSSIDKAFARGTLVVSAGLKRTIEYEDIVHDTDPSVAINYAPSERTLPLPPFNGEQAIGIAVTIELETAAGYVRQSTARETLRAKRIWFDRPIEAVYKGGTFPVEAGNCLLVVRESVIEHKYSYKEKPQQNGDA